MRPVQYIVLDLEWNQPINHQTRVYREVGDRLIFEMIQIGACKLDSEMNLMETISVPIHPTCYQRIHPRIARMTHLGEEELADAPLFQEAMDRFVAWCEREGEEYCLLTWGSDDVSVLQQNLDFFNCHPKLPPVCDIQHLFSDVHKLQNRMGLQPAMELLGIEAEEGRDFHNAENDAYYTALVFRTVPNPADALKYPREPKQLIRPDVGIPGKPKGENFASVKEAIRSEAAQKPKCPVCGKGLQIEEAGYVPQAADKYIGLAKCARHGTALVRLRLRAGAGGKVQLWVNTVKATPPNIAYVHTKQYQLAQRRAAGFRFNAEEALRNAERSSVPFED